MDRNPLFPVFLKLDQLNTLVVGAGNVGLEKLSALLKNSPKANVTVIAPNVHPELDKLASTASTVTIIRRRFRSWDLRNRDLVILATDDKELHIKIQQRARRRRILINVADTPDLCDFYLGSVITRGHLKVGISTNGKSPTLARRMREYFEEALPDDMNQLLDNLEQIRGKMKGDFQAKLKALNELTSGMVRKDDSGD